MLIQFTPPQVNEFWSQIAPALLTALPIRDGYGPFTLTNLLRELLLEEAILWGFYEDDEVVAWIVTVFTFDDIAGARELLIYAFAGVGKLDAKRIWVDGLETLRKFAEASNCLTLSAYVQHPQLVNLLEDLYEFETVTKLIRKV